MWLPERAGLKRVGLLDFQDALAGPAAYDLVSLLQDARLDVPETLEAELLDRYCAARGAREPHFSSDEFRTLYATLGAQRNSKILGIFARLAKRDGKRGYLSHLPRVARYLARNLSHPGACRLTRLVSRASFPLRISFLRFSCKKVSAMTRAKTAMVLAAGQGERMRPLTLSHTEAARAARRASR